MLRSKSLSVTLIGRSSRSGLPHLAHLGPADRRVRSTRLAAKQMGHRTTTGRPGWVLFAVVMNTSHLVCSKLIHAEGQGNWMPLEPCGLPRGRPVTIFTDGNLPHGISVADMQMGVSH